MDGRGVNEGDGKAWAASTTKNGKLSLATTMVAAWQEEEDRDDEMMADPEDPRG